MKTEMAEARPAAGSEHGPTAYEKDVILWAEEQARYLREGRFSELDIEHLADEIEDVGRSEKRELASRMAVLLAHLLKWRVQPEKRSKSWRTTIMVQRQAIDAALIETPSLRTVLRDPAWQKTVWGDALTQALRETGLDDLPDVCPWSMDEARDPDFWPE
jgi:hypothetical protein